MRKAYITILLLMLVTVFAATAFAAQPKTYQVTGPIVEVKGDIVVVQNKNGEKWEKPSMIFLINIKTR